MNRPYKGRDQALWDVLKCLEGVECWVDSGTLLALRREGKLLDWDGDIDLACWNSAVPEIVARRKDLVALGYRVALRTTAEQPYKIKLTPPLRQRRKGALHVDISIYHRQGEWAVSPGIYRYRPPTPVWKFPHIFGHAARELLLISWLALGARRNFRLNRPKIDMRLFSWCVPADMFASLSPLNVAGNSVLVPTQNERYLSFRYGDWNTPRQQWSYFHDDQSVLDIRPEKTLRGECLPSSTEAWEFPTDG